MTSTVYMLTCQKKYISSFASCIYKLVIYMYIHVHVAVCIIRQSILLAASQEKKLR